MGCVHEDLIINNSIYKEGRPEKAVFLFILSVRLELRPCAAARFSKPAVILSGAKDPVFNCFGGLFTGLFTASRVRMTGGLGAFVRPQGLPLE